MKNKINFFWFRRDLRLDDNTGLYHALKSGKKVQCVFIFDKNILDKLEEKSDRRVVFIHRQLEQINKELISFGSSLLTVHDTPENAWRKWIKEFDIDAIFTNHDYEPYAQKRDEGLKNIFEENKINFNTYKDQVIFEKSEIIKDDGKPYTVFTPFKNKYLKNLSPAELKSNDTSKFNDNFHQIKPLHILKLSDIGFKDLNINFPEKSFPSAIIKNYAEKRDFPGLSATSQLSIHLRFGTISIRKLAKEAIKQKSDVFLNELIWREFYQMILWHFPHVEKSAFKPAYDHIQWRNNETEFHKWCEGKTGYPIVDAGMREINQTGFMHNRVRMIVASFLVKHLLIDWRWGEAYFAKNLIDFDLASNNGGWQWAAGSGCDAAPYFRIFNPSEQTKKFDPEFKYIKKWVPEFEELNYPPPIVDHKFARERALSVYKKSLQEK